MVMLSFMTPNNVIMYLMYTCKYIDIIVGERERDRRERERKREREREWLIDMFTRLRPNVLGSMIIIFCLAKNW